MHTHPRYEKVQFSFWFWRYLTRGIIWQLTPSFIRTSVYFSSILKSRSNPFLQPTRIKQGY